MESQIPFASPFPNFVFVCPSNCGSAILIDKTAVIPSLASSPDNESVFPFTGLN